jgi:type III restriction enzyme
MTVTAKRISKHPYVTQKKGVCGGRSVIRSTRIPVWSLIQWYKQGMTIEDIMREFPQLKPAQVHDAFSYYYDNRKEVEKDITENEMEPHAVAS